MRNLVSFYMTVLAVVFVLCLGLGSAGEYDNERITWKIQNDFQKMINQPQSIPDGAVSDIISRYEQFIRKHPKSALVPKVQLSMGNIYVFLNDYPKAREIFEQIIKNYSYNAEVVAQAEFELGKSYEVNGQWEEAIGLYKTIVKNSPVTSTGFSAPFYIAQLYSSKGTQQQAEEALVEAVEFYQNIAANNANEPLEYVALHMLIECRLVQGNWQDAFDNAKRLMFQFPSAPTLFDTVTMIKDICVGKMNDKTCAVDTYKEFMHKNPGHPVNPALLKVIDNINK